MIFLTENDLQNAVHIGDGAYVLDLGYAIEVFTSNGITKENAVVLEDDMVDALVDFKNNRRK